MQKVEEGLGVEEEQVEKVEEKETPKGGEQPKK